MIETMLHEGTEGSSYGVFGFEYMPSPGDHIHIGNARGSIDVLCVMHVQHHPTNVPPLSSGHPRPYVSILVKLIDEYGD